MHANRKRQSHSWLFGRITVRRENFFKKILSPKPPLNFDAIS